MATSGLCSAVQIPSPVNDKVPVGSDPISAPKAMQHSFGPLAVGLMCQFEDNAVAVCAAECCRTVQVSRPVKNQARGGADPILALKAMQHGFGPLAVELMC